MAGDNLLVAARGYEREVAVLDGTAHGVEVDYRIIVELHVRVIDVLSDQVDAAASQRDVLRSRSD